MLAAVRLPCFYESVFQHADPYQEVKRCMLALPKSKADFSVGRALPVVDLGDVGRQDRPIGPLLGSLQDYSVGASGAIRTVTLSTSVQKGRVEVVARSLHLHVECYRRN
jgi:hypothetical protein